MALGNYSNAPPAWDGNWTNDCFVASCWQGADEERLVVAVNYAPNQSQCRLLLPFSGLSGKSWLLHDQISSDTYQRDGNELHHQGLFVDLGPWRASVFALRSPSGLPP